MQESISRYLCDRRDNSVLSKESSENGMNRWDVLTTVAFFFFLDRACVRFYECSNINGSLTLFRSKGVILNVASASGMYPVPLLTLYSSTKASHFSCYFFCVFMSRKSLRKVLAFVVNGLWRCFGSLFLSLRKKLCTVCRIKWVYPLQISLFKMSTLYGMQRHVIFVYML